MQDQLADIRRELADQRQANEGRERRIRAHANVTAAAEEARHRYHDIASKLRQAFVPYRIAYELQQRTIEARQRQIDAARMAFIELFFVGVAGAAGGAIQQVIRQGQVLRSEYGRIALGTAAADIEKYLTRLVPQSAGRREAPPQAPPQPGAQAQTPQAPAPQAPAPQGASPQQAPAQPQAAQAPQAPDAQGAGPAADGGVEPISWLETLMGRLDGVSSQVSRALSNLAGALARGEEPPEGSEDPTALVARILQPLDALGTIQVQTQQQYGLLLWTQWIEQHWLDETVSPDMEPGRANERIVTARASDAPLLAQIRQQSGGSDRAYEPALQARFQQTRERAGRRQEQEIEGRRRLLGSPSRQPRSDAPTR